MESPMRSHTCDTQLPHTDGLNEKRAEYFLQHLGSEVGTFAEEERSKFDRYISSPEGGEIRSDFIDAATRTSSRLAIAVLALLYADHQNERYSQAAWLLPLLRGAAHGGNRRTPCRSRHPSGPEERFEYSNLITALQFKRDEAAVKLQGISVAGDDEWEDLKTGTERVWGEVRTILHEAIMKIK
jgi:hypothetical protein